MVINSVGEFKYRLEEEVTSGYFHPYEEAFQKDYATKSNKKKIRLLLEKFGQSEHEKFVNYLLPGEISFEETVLILKGIFRERGSLLNTRWQCLNLTKTWRRLLYFCWDSL